MHGNRVQHFNFVHQVHQILSDQSHDISSVRNCAVSNSWFWKMVKKEMNTAFKLTRWLRGHCTAQSGTEEGNEEKWHLTRDQKTSIEGAEVTKFGKLFHTRAVATGKAQSSTVDRRDATNDQRPKVQLG